MIELSLPYPPSANRYWRNVGGKTLVSAEARNYKNLAAWMAKQQWGGDLLTGEIVMTIHVYRPQKSGDLVNRLKVLEDALQGIVYNNDSQIVETHAYRHDDKADPRVEIMVYEL